MNAMALLGAVIRLLVVLLVGWAAARGFDWVTTRGDKTGGANIGAGLFAFAVAGLLIVAWSFVDGRREGFPALWTWAAMALLLGLLNGGIEFFSARHMRSIPTVADGSAGFLPTPDPWTMGLTAFGYTLTAALFCGVLGTVIGALTSRQSRSG